MIKYFTKIKWGGGDCILVTGEKGEPLLILTQYEIRCLNKELKSK